jgi:hypothetical protein
LKECRGGVTAGELFRWIWEADFYFIIGHIHQGLKHMDVEVLWDKISMLASHIGFPAGLNLRCPVFIQDKFVYISACHEITIPTLKVVFDEYDDDHDVINPLFVCSRGPRMRLLDFLNVRLLYLM